MAPPIADPAETGALRSPQSPATTQGGTTGAADSTPEAHHSGGRTPGHWTEVAEVLSTTYTVVTYDRRGNSRSLRPAGWTATTIDEQADDAEALISGLHLAPAIVLGTSAAAGIVTDLAIRHPSVLGGVIFHEPVFQSGVTNAAAVRARRLAAIEEGMTRGGRRGAAEAFLRNVGGDEVYDSLDPALRERLLANADVLFDIELVPFVAYEPTPGDLVRIQVPRAVTVAPSTATPLPPATGGTNQHNGSPPTS
jgi:pimeloyl-ACP methyl ester carboxylesterase